MISTAAFVLAALFTPLATRNVADEQVRAARERQSRACLLRRKVGAASLEIYGANGRVRWIMRR